MKERRILMSLGYLFLLVAIFLAISPMISYRYSYAYEGPNIWQCIATTILAFISFCIFSFSKYEV